MSYSAEPVPILARTPHEPMAHRAADGDWRGMRHVFAEFALIAGAALAYFGVRGLTQGSESTAVANAGHVLGLERLVGLDVEASLQGLVLVS